jgi:hypothetical protein
MVNQILIGLGLDRRSIGLFMGSMQAVRNSLESLWSQALPIMQYKHDLNLFSAASYVSAGKLKQINTQLNITAENTGIAREELLQSALQIIDATGKVGSSVNNLSMMAEVAVGTGSNLSDLGTVVAGLSNNFGIADDQMREFMNTVISQGDIGSLPFRKLAPEIKELTMAANQLRVKGKSDLTDFFGFTQIAFRNIGSASEMTTSFNNFAKAYSTSKIRKNLGVVSFDIVNGTKIKKSFSKYIEDIVASTKGSEGKLIKAMDIRAAKAFAPLMRVFREAGGGEEGRKAIQAFFDVFRNNNVDVITEKLNRMQKDPVVALNRYKELKKTLSEIALTPAIDVFVGEMNKFLSNKQNINDIKESFIIIANVLSGMAKILLPVLNKLTMIIGTPGAIGGMKSGNAWQEERAGWMIMKAYNKLTPSQQEDFIRRTGIQKYGGAGSGRMGQALPMSDEDVRLALIKKYRLTTTVDTKLNQTGINVSGGDQPIFAQKAVDKLLQEEIKIHVTVGDKRGDIEAMVSRQDTQGHYKKASFYRESARNL